MEWSEIDWKGYCLDHPRSSHEGWPVHRVPLTERMIAIFEDVQKQELDDQFVFVGLNKHKPFSDMALARS